MVDPWARPATKQLAQWHGPPPVGAAPWQQLRRMSLRSVPDARTPVPLRWWVLVVAVLMLAATTAAILPGVS